MIGFYDTGKGGQSIINAVKKRAPDLEYEFYIDSDALPLGEKSHGYIQQTVVKGCESLFSKGCKLVILACNTASVHTIRYLQTEWLPNNYPDRQVLGVTTPLLEFSEQYFQSHKPLEGWLLATQATCIHPYYKEEFAKRGFDFLHPIAAPGLADAIERGDEQKMREILGNLDEKSYSDPAYIALACTHYTYAKPIIREIFPSTDIIDPTEFIAERTLDYIKRHPEYQ